MAARLSRSHPRCSFARETEASTIGGSGSTGSTISTSNRCRISRWPGVSRCSRPPRVVAAGGWRTSGTSAQSGAPSVRAAVDIGAVHAGREPQLQPAGYVEREFLLEGTAQSYVKRGRSGAATESGMRRPVIPHRTWSGSWCAIRGSRPRFNGVVFVEWFNVSGQTEGDPNFSLLHTELLRDGYAYVGVGAQAAGIYGAGGLKNRQPRALHRGKPSGRLLLVRHLHAGGTGHPRAAGHGAARRVDERHPPSHRGRGIAVGVADGHLRQRGAPAGPGVRRVLHPQQVRRFRIARAGRGEPADDADAGAGPDPRATWTPPCSPSRRKATSPDSWRRGSPIPT